MNAARGIAVALGLGLLATASLRPEETEAAGAKELFFGRSGMSVRSSLEARQPSTPRQRRPAERHKQAELRPPGGEVARETPIAEGTPVAEAVGLHYWVELVQPGSAAGERVVATRGFRSGERIRLHFQSNRPGYITLVQLGSRGAVSPLFPDAAKGQTDNHIEAFTDRILPNDNAWFRFDDQPGTERLLVLFAASREEQPLLGATQLAALVDGGGREALQAALAGARGGKDLVLEDDASAGDEAGAYAVNVAGGAVVVEILLQHS